MPSSCRIAIVGGGLAGLAAAHALRTFGTTAEVFEAAAALGEIGAAVNVSPQAVKALQAIDLGDQVAAVATSSPGIYTRNMQTFKHMRDSAAQKESIASGKGSVHGSADWVWGYDPVGEWDKEPSVPTAYAA
jgi:2-polyprenyl-6-methoxyphenol hydroxylase-like FAD-dependent oxidoreductase